MAMTVKAKVEVWVTLDVDTDDLEDAYTEAEEAITAERSDLVWGAPEVTDMEYVDTVAAESCDEDAAYEEYRDRIGGALYA